MSVTTCDTSVIVPLLAGWHPHHHEVRTLAEDLTHVGAQVLLESFSVLTRLPAPHRVAPAAAAEVLGLPLTPVTLPADEHAGVIAQLAAQGIRGGAVYDGLIASTAARHSLLLLTRDRRARLTYDAPQVPYRLV